jgi:hypothetical protein
VEKQQKITCSMVVLLAIEDRTVLTAILAASSAG